MVLIHCFILCISNILVLFPIKILGLSTTFGAFTYPLLFVVTDLTTQLKGSEQARLVVYKAIIPGLILSFLFSTLVQMSLDNQQMLMPLRVAFAGLTAYALGQIMDIFVFQPLRTQKSWWIAPSVASFVGNLVDTLCFFFVAFYQCSDPFLATHWQEIALVDFAVKVMISQLTFIPLYGVLLRFYPIYSA